VGVACFLITPSHESLRFLRRYADLPRGVCPAMPGPHGYHQAMAYLDRAPTTYDANGYICGPDDLPHDDPRWPRVCACGQYTFLETDTWQVFTYEMYRAVDGRPGEGTIHPSPAPGVPPVPPGAMWNAWWMEFWRKPDGLCLSVRLPSGEDWLIDGPASNGPGWTRTGEPPRITVRPSILTPKYHGFLTDGTFDAC
jgi:hypothetical protein